VAAPIRRRVNLAVNLLSLGLLVVSFATGWVASLLGLTEFGVHKYTSIALVFLAAAHLAMHWRTLVNQLRRKRTARIEPEAYGVRLVRVRPGEW
jgi:hypothetical protein